MKKSVMVFLVLLLLTSIDCYAQDYYSAEEIDVNLEIKGDFEIIETGKGSSIKYVVANLSFFPKDSLRQEVGVIKTTPKTDVEEEGVPYLWEKPKAGKYNFELESNIKLKNWRNEVKTKVVFPITTLPKHIMEYIKPTTTIDSDDDEVIRLANTLASGEEDLFVVAHKLAEWTKNNIQYNLSTLTVSVSEPASWVLENRLGVCDELTNLFIALCRSLGIPARFVAGIAYSDSDLFVDDWGPHGWAEVYFPRYGWVDYDVTFGEFGFIDPAHIKLKDSFDATQSSTIYNWLGYNVEVKTGNLDMITEVKGSSGEYDSNIDMVVYPEKDEIGPSSYNIINARIKNKNDYYISEEISIYKSKEVGLEEGNVKNVLLKPGETKTVSWIINIGDIEYGYIYTFPVTIKDILNKTAQTSFKAGYGGPEFTKYELIELVESRKEKAKKKYSKDINLSCEPNKEEFYVYDNNTLNCILKNKGNVFLENIEVCFKDICEKIDLGISQKKAIDFTFSEEKEGKKEKEVRAISKDALASSSVKYSALDQPEIEILEIIYPKNVSYDEDYTIEFLMKKKSFSNPVDITVTLNQGGYEKTWIIEEMIQDRKFIIDMEGKNMVEGKNVFEIKVDYKDRLENEYSNKKDIEISLTNLNLAQKIIVSVNYLGRDVLSKRGFIIFIIVTGIVFFAIFKMVFKKEDKEEKEKIDKDIIVEEEKEEDNERREES